MSNLIRLMPVGGLSFHRMGNDGDGYSRLGDDDDDDDDDDDEDDDDDDDGVFIHGQRHVIVIVG